MSAFGHPKAITLPLLAGSWLALAVPAVWAQPEARLSAPAGDDFYRPREKLQLSLPDELAIGGSGQLSLELDGMDVSALAEWRGTELVYRPVRPLAAGAHELRVVFYGQHGRIQELGYWTFEVRHSAALRELRANGQFNLGFSQRVSERDRDGGSDLQGGGHLESGLSGDNWRLDSSLDLVAVNNKDLAVAGREVDLARFNLRGEYGRYRLALGDQQLASASLIQDGFERRGLSTAARLPLWDGSLSLYRAGSRQQPGIDAGLGTDDADNRLSGGRVEFWPLRGDSAQLMLAGGRLSGRVGESDYGTLYPQEAAGTEPAVNEGDAWNLVADGQFFQRQLRLRLEKAGSEYDFDGVDSGFAAERDNAWSALLVLDPLPHSELDWRLGLESKKLGTWYRSLANRYAPADRQMERVFFDISRDKWSWDGGYALENNNLSRNTAYAISETRQWHLNTRYTDYDLPQWPLLAALGRPSYTLSVEGTRLQDQYTPPGYLVNDLQTRRYALTAAFARQQLQWSAGYHHDSLKDASGWQPETRTQATRLDAGWYPNHRYSVFVGWELQHTTYPDRGISTDRHIYSVDAKAEFIPQRLRGNLGLGLNETSARDDPFFARWDQTTYISAQLSWQIRQPDSLVSGLELILSASRNDYRDRLFPSTLPADSPADGYQAFIELRSSLPVAYPGGQP
ncbi:hypothetical protein [Microbulbifer halophilus]|uniref:TonB-dependent receptor n=1 Tax=Microbulbifer halophilus TaxID=453963 RepID=A0ABW5EHU8_9GAMM|nr:hypothetical protein [Microbulbifer halophilus]